MVQVPVIEQQTWDIYLPNLMNYINLKAFPLDNASSYQKGPALNETKKK